MKTKKILRTALALFLVCLLLFGMVSCVSYEMTAEFSAFEKVSVDLSATMEKATYELLVSEFPTMFDGYRKESYTEDGKEMLRFSEATLTFDSFAAAEQGLKEITLPVGAEKEIPLFKAVSLEVYEDNLWFSGTVSAVDDGTESVSLRITVKMPAATLAHPESDAGIVVSEDERTATFTVGDESFYFCIVSGSLIAAQRAATIRTLVIAVIAVVLVALAVVLVVFALRRRAARKKAIAPSTEADAPESEE